MYDESSISIEGLETIELSEQPPGTRRAMPTKVIFSAAIVLVILVAGYVMYFRGPASATAAMAHVEPPDAIVLDDARVNLFLNEGRAEIPAMRAALAKTVGIVRDFLIAPSAEQAPLASISHNPFFTPAASIPSHAPSAADTKHATRADILQAVESLQLQSILRTDTRRDCMINNVIYNEGEVANGFTIEQINAQTVVIRNGLYRFELTINR
jgi:hypothetical protein